MTGFVTKKIGRKQSLGKLFRAARVKAELSVEEAESRTKICAKYLMALEEGNYEQLPAEAYNTGFVRGYADFLGLNKEKVLSLYREERSRQHFVSASTILQPRKTRDWQFLVTPKVLGIAFSLLLFGGVTSYIVVQLRQFNQPPLLTIKNVPSEFTTSKDIVELSGQTADGATVTINAEPITVHAGGVFDQNVQLNPGLNEILVASKNRAQKESRQLVKVLYKPNLAQASGTTATE